MINLFLILIAYLIGSLSSAVIYCRLKGLPDPRDSGSNNPGATNVLRLYGKPAALITLLGDLLKGFIPVLLAKFFGAPDATIAFCGLAAFLGHLYPVFFGFKGGKGVATFVGVILAMAWPVGLVFIVMWLITALLFKYSSVAALVATLISVLAVAIFLPPPYYLLSCVLMAIMIYWRHRSNIRNLIDGTEDKLSDKKTEEE